MKPPLAAFLLGAALLTGCGASSPMQISKDGVNFQPLTPDGLDKPCSSPFRVCIQDDSFVSVPRTERFTGYFASATRTMKPDYETCDLVVKFIATWNDNANVTSAKDGSLVGRVDGRSATNTASALCQALSDGGLLAGNAEPRYPGVAAKRPSSSPALSAADVARIAQAMQAAPAAIGPSFSASPVPRFSAAERPNDVAVIVGIETYSDIAAKAQYAERDADAFKSYVRALGVPERNIVLLKGSKAGKASLEKNLDAWLPRMAAADSRVYFYFSGHGAPDVKTGQAYLVPWDGDPNFLESTAYPVAKLYKKLAELPVKQVLVAMDSCFSGAGGRSVLASGARPLVGKIDTGSVPAKLTVLAASASNEISGSLDDKGHGAFTYFLLEGLNAGKNTPKALNEYLTPRVQDEARRLNRDQTPQLHGDGGWTLK